MRLSYFNNGSGAEVLEENNFYPFGLKHEGYNAQAGNPSYNYQYNGKELQTETGWSDFGARMYMSDIGRWGVIDPLAETSRRFNPYNYALNNPVMFVDPDGRKAQYLGSEYDVFGLENTGFIDRFIMGGNPFASFLSFLGNDMPFNTGSYSGTGAGSKVDNGGGSSTFGETQAYKDIMALFGGDPGYFKGIDFSKFGAGLNDPGNPLRKYLQQKTNAYFGAIESVDQYQLNHANWIDEYQGTMDFLGNMKEYFDSASDKLGGASISGLALDNLKTAKELFEKFKNFNPSLASTASAIMGVVGTSISMESERFGQIMDIYKNASYRYDQLHKQNTSLNRGVTVNVNVVIGTNGGGYTNIMIYDISTHRYLSGGQIVHRK